MPKCILIVDDSVSIRQKGPPPLEKSIFALLPILEVAPPRAPTDARLLSALPFGHPANACRTPRCW